MSEELVIRTLDAVLPPIADRITALIAAGDKLAGYAGHDYTCLTQQWGRWAEPCDCGYAEAVKAWKELTK